MTAGPQPSIVETLSNRAIYALALAVTLIGFLLARTLM